MIEVKISPAQRRKLESELRNFASRSGIAVAETVAIIGQSVAKELASKVQPWGLSKKQGDKFELNILKQVSKAARYATYKGAPGEVSDVHARYRNKNGAVTVRTPDKIQPKRKPFVRPEVLNEAKKKQANAGIAKAGWIAAGESIDSPLLKTAKGISRRIKGIAPWIRRHVNSNKGSSAFIRKGGLNSTIYLTNKVDYAYSKAGTNGQAVQRAIADGYKRTITIIKARLKKLQ
jgi:hypothetical protein